MFFSFLPCWAAWAAGPAAAPAAGPAAGGLRLHPGPGRQHQPDGGNPAAAADPAAAYLQECLGGGTLYLAPPAESHPPAAAPVFTSPLPTPEPAEEQGSGGAEEPPEARKRGSGGAEDPLPTSEPAEVVPAEPTAEPTPTVEPAEPAPEPTLEPDSPSGWQQNLPGWLGDLAVSASSFLGELFTPTTPALASSPFSSPIGIQGEESLPPVQAGRTVITTTYDSLYRLTSAIYSDGRTYGYTYDATGNRLSQTTPAGVTTYGYNNANQLVSANGVPYTYDNNGNLTNDGVYTYGYDAANRLTSVTNGPLTTQYQYNGDGDRTRRWLNGTETRYALDPVGLTDILAETTAGQTTRYLPGLVQVNGSDRQYFLPDRLGSVRLVMPSVAGAEPALLRNYDPFGKLSAQSGTGSTFGYTGEPMEPLGGLVYLARYYQPGTGRFLTPDPFPGMMMQPGTLNPYVYVGNNAVNLTDPSGQCPTCVPAAPLLAFGPPGWLAYGGLAIVTTVGVVVIVQNGPEIRTALGDIFTPPYVPPDQEGFTLSPCPDPAHYPGVTLNTGQYLGGTLTFPLDEGDPRLQIKPAVPSLTINILEAKYKEPKKGAGGKEGATDVPSWAKGERPFVGESGSQFAKRLLDMRYGRGNYPTGPGSEYNKLKKYADRHFQ